MKKLTKTERKHLKTANIHNKADLEYTLEFQKGMGPNWVCSICKSVLAKYKKT